MKRTIGWKIGLILALIVLSLWGLIPFEKIKLGLDLKGGLHLVLNVEADEAILLRTQRTAGELKNLLNKNNTPFEKIKSLGKDKIQIQGISPANKENIQEIVEKHLSEWSADYFPHQVILSLPASVRTAMREHCLRQSIETIRERINTYGLNDSGVQRLGGPGEDKILVTLPGVDDPGRVKDLIKSTAMLEFKHVKAGPFPNRDAALAQYNGSLPDDLMIFPANPKRLGTAFYVLSADSVVIGDDLKNASKGQDGFGGWEVHFSLNSLGAEKIKAYSAANIGKYLAIIFDKQIESVARIDGVLSYHTRITGNYTYDEVNDMVLKLQSGALSAAMTPVEERVIGPSLGADSIKKGITAAVTGLVLIVVFMVAYYGGAGLNSAIALSLNILLLLAIMTYFGFSLTVPGIAGIILTIGMAVDANVLIFERIKEELALGTSTLAAIDSGFKKALVTILDANLTTVIAAVFLMQLSSGPVKGFAVALIIGIIVSMFTALLVSKVIFHLVYVKKGGRSTHTTLKFPWKTHLFKKEAAIPFMNKKAIWTTFILSGLIILAGGIILFFKSFNLGVDFTGGTMIEVNFKKTVNEQELRSRLTKVDLNQAMVQRVGKTGQKFFIKTTGATLAAAGDRVNGTGPGEVLSDLIKKAVSPLGDFTVLSVDTVGPQIGAAFKHKTFIAACGALVGMLIYIGFRFKMSYGLSAVFTLIHDILVCLTVLLVFNVEVTLQVAAALLTIIGYSLNDTIVIFDRVRDNLKQTKRGNPGKQGITEKVLNQSITQTLGRTLVTSGTTLLAVLALFFLGGEVLRDFAFTLMIGILVGTYSSIFQSCGWLRFLKI